MALYLGRSEQQKVILNGVVYRFNLYSTTLITNGIRLLSSDDYILKSSDGYYLTANESEYIEINEDDNYIFK